MLSQRRRCACIHPLGDIKASLPLLPSLTNPATQLSKSFTPAHQPRFFPPTCVQPYCFRKASSAPLPSLPAFASSRLLSTTPRPITLSSLPISNSNSNKEPCRPIPLPPPSSNGPMIRPASSSARSLLSVTTLSMNPTQSSPPKRKLPFEKLKELQPMMDDPVLPFD